MEERVCRRESVCVCVCVLREKKDEEILNSMKKISLFTTYE